MFLIQLQITGLKENNKYLWYQISLNKKLLRIPILIDTVKLFDYTVIFFLNHISKLSKKYKVAKGEDYVHGNYKNIGFVLSRKIHVF